MSEVVFEHATVPQGKETKDETPKGVARPHRPGESGIRCTLREDIDWKPFPAFPSSVRLAVVVGTPSERGPYTIRVKASRWRQVDAAQAPGGSSLHSVIRGFLYRGTGSIR